ncbi:Na+/H+ antiporter NhaA [Ponticoccus sp. SC2-23]|uniref:Na+/H+ antiporter NhaA n=1 Tax=Alexandriicola marinus TaxID=2081710 RepID=UPI000FDB0FD7|nr:Na+/H+ antiporter NhaA [Alexandriicola marinus]MBM1219734.1 Na+/H+ antiporter NhaA [Ponticoccus sp. SC6-9]MBM1223194.1 Na+/H+ antiporter NhaA [Ponticoccus sp. SC6-15]MBM1229547.1 Na+/H+ antiporter NhaA [Ponticoccus sp. SC6-38]MBM1232160.1 Na+/H+ antiporter NhaA [Ponticoccus sp. SC6-45]MBM1237890.1 Na+/H+ antiporter NhaA [Ponticoccus sp. SC6-49]MBM1241171.1 Na+/H+ antiporter NhaA [Ponticoccus sp. SC2-64]MBM1245684.1 Na+/H+ antiporter NhaA [Ponticoccus sp. SC6-42]MBM1250162.1 Na+/H+ antipo
MYRAWNFLTNYSLLLLIGAAIALVWANLDNQSYRGFADLVIADGVFIGEPVLSDTGEIVTRSLTLHYLVNNVLMAFFFALAGKEVWEALILQNGALRGRKAATPLIATLGGMAGPALVYLGLAAVLGSETHDAVSRGWAIPTATDIAFAYLFGRLIFGAGHPAVRFLLLIAIADDAIGLIIIAVFYPAGALELGWLGLSAAAAIGVFVLCNWLPRRLDRGRETRPNSTWVRHHLSFWPYLVAGCLSWFGFQEAGLHPALGLLPIVPTLPHADRAFGIFSEAEQYLTDLLNHVQTLLRYPVEIILFLFGLLNAGVEFSSIGAPTWLVLAGLLIGKPVGILTFGWFAARPLKLGLPKGMGLGDLAVIGCVAAVGFTVSIFIASVAFAPGAMLGAIPVEDAAKMGALFGLASFMLAMGVARLVGVARRDR